MTLSIVIPVYNVEQYISSTLDSIYCQEFEESLFEVIIVNDGTPDNSMSIVEEYASKHANLRIINQENQGLSGARNTGLAAAQGEYVWFVDSDDRVTEGSMDLVISTITSNPNKNMYGFGIYTEKEEDKTQKYFAPLTWWCGAEPFNRDVNYSTMLNHTMGPTARYVFKKAFLVQSQLLFWKGILHEDVDFLNKAFFYAKTIWLRKEPTYIYLERSGNSIMSTIKMKTFHDLMKICRSFEEIRESHKQNTQARIFWDAVMWRTSTIILNPNMRGHGLAEESKEEYRTFLCENAKYFRTLSLRGIKASIMTHAWKDVLLAGRSYLRAL